MACGFKEDQKSPSSWKYRQRAKTVCRHWLWGMQGMQANVTFKIKQDESVPSIYIILYIIPIQHR